MTKALTFPNSKAEPSTETMLAGLNRSLPFSDEAEKGVLSGLLHDPRERLSAARVAVPVEAFYHETNRIIYEMLLAFYDRGTPLDIATLTHALREQQVIDKVGGAGAISQLYSFIPVVAHYEFYLKVMMDKHTLRLLIHACAENMMAAYEHGTGQIDDDVAGTLDRAEQRVLKVRELVAHKDAIKPLKEHVMDAIDDMEEMLANPGQLRGLSTGYERLDELSAGLKGSEMFVIAARPSMGKTALLMNIVEHVALDVRKPVAVFSLEMSAAMLVKRLLVSRARISMSTLQRGLLSETDHDALAKSMKDLQQASIWIDETPGLDILELRAKARRLHKQHGIALIAIDYLQLLTSSSRKAKDNRQIEIAEISAGIKGIAKELNVPVIVLAQLNRAVEQRKGQRPMLSDLRESGSIEQDADLVGLLTRADYAGSKQPGEEEDEPEREQGESTLIIAKNRNGPTDEVPLTFVSHSMRFTSRTMKAE